MTRQYLFSVSTCDTMRRKWGAYYLGFTWVIPSILAQQFTMYITSKQVENLNASFTASMKTPLFKAKNRNSAMLKKHLRLIKQRKIE